MRAFFQSRGSLDSTLHQHGRIRGVGLGVNLFRETEHPRHRFVVDLDVGEQVRIVFPPQERNPFAEVGKIGGNRASLVADQRIGRLRRRRRGLRDEGGEADKSEE